MILVGKIRIPQNGIRINRLSTQRHGDNPKRQRSPRHEKVFSFSLHQKKRCNSNQERNDNGHNNGNPKAFGGFGDRFGARNGTHVILATRGVIGGKEFIEFWIFKASLLLSDRHGYLMRDQERESADLVRQPAHC